MRNVRHGRIAELDGATVFGLARLRQDVFVVEQECAYPDLDDLDTDPATVHFWIEDDGAVVACLRTIREGSVGRIGRVCSAAASRGQGLAAKLMTAALDQAGANADLVLHSQTYAAGFYRRFGFVEEGPEFLEDDIPHVLMRRAGRN